MSKSQRKRLSQTFRVTQPPRSNSQIAPYPERTTRIGGNDRFILAANHPSWYEVAGKHEDAMMAFLNPERLASGFEAVRKMPEAQTLFHMYGFVLIRLLTDYVRRKMPANRDLEGVFKNAVGTVIGNLSRNIFDDRLGLTGTSYTYVDFLRWRRNFLAFKDQDVFVYRPPEQGRDIDGRTKPIVELCPTPRLGRYLVAHGFALLMKDVERRNPGQATLATHLGSLQLGADHSSFDAMM